MALRQNLEGAHLPPLQAIAVTGVNSMELSAGVATTLLGATQGTAVQLTADVNNVTGATNTGGLLPPATNLSDRVSVYNSGANTVKIYPNTAAGTINGGAAGVAVTLATLTGISFTLISSPDNWATGM